MRMFLLFLFSLLLHSGRIFAQTPLTGAVIEFEASERALAGQAGEASILLNALLSQTEDIQLVERVSLQKILEEQEMGLAGIQDNQTAIQVGKLLGAEVLITGRVFKVGDTLYLAAKTISTESGRVFGYTAKVASLKELDLGVEKLAEEISEGLKENKAVFAPTAETMEAYIARLQKQVPKGDKPKVKVSVQEEHLSREVIDPAVETEIKSVLMALGYEIVAHENEAEISITGEAFSEFAARYGRLVSCRARLELQVKDVKTGEILLVDRVVVAQVDLAENIAAKGALAKAARETLPEIIQSMN